MYKKICFKLSDAPALFLRETCSLFTHQRRRCTRITDLMSNSKQQTKPIFCRTAETYFSNNAFKLMRLVRAAVLCGSTNIFWQYNTLRLD